MHPLIDVISLARELDGDRPPVVLDVRWRLGGPPGVEDYLRGHIPGAVFVDLDRDLSGPPGPGRHPLPDAATLAAAMRRCGVADGRAAVAYDDGDASAAARAWWVLRYFGHRRVQVLDGGYRAWLNAGLPTTTDVPDPEPGDFAARPGGMAVLDAAQAARVARDGVLVDARAPERYRGEVEPVDPVAGHIPGAVNAPTRENLGAEGRFRAPADLREHFRAIGVTGDEAVGAYCGSGVSAAQAVLALEVAGVTAALYVGSWSDWVTDPTRPIATSADH